MLFPSQAVFIQDPKHRKFACPIFRKEFSVGKAVAKAVLNVTALGIYEAQLNGTPIGAFRFAPGWTSYRFRVQVQSYDVTSLVSDASNVLDITVGSGWYAGDIQRGVYVTPGSPVALIACLTLTYEDGTTEEIVTDPSWQVAKSRYLLSDLYQGEICDANYLPSDWQNAVEYPKPAGLNLIPQEGEEVHETEEVRAVSYFITPKGEKIIDFGQNITGYVCFRTVGRIGDSIRLDFAEVLDVNGNFYTENYRGARSEIHYITDGNTEAWYHPHFTFQGFRYVRLTEYPEKSIYPGDFYAIVVHSDMKRIGHFRCSDRLINRLYENVIWGQRGNFLDIPTDCPQRDERLGWTADAQVFCRTAAYNYNVLTFFRKWLRDIALDQAENGAVQGYVPCAGQGSGEYGWGDAAVIAPWEMYRAYGARDLLEEQFHSMCRWIDYIDAKGDGPDGWTGGHQFGDWLGLDKEEGGSYHGATDDKLLGTAFLYHSNELVIRSGKILGKDVAKYEALQERVKAAYLDTFVKKDDGLLTCNTQTAYVCTLHFGLAPDKKKYADHLAQMIRANGNKLTTGFLGTPYLLDALTENGYADVAYDLLLQKEFPSWLYSVRKGATTIWEHWDGLKPDGSMWSAAMNSFNHYAYGSVAAWMYGTMAGIRPDEDKPGYENIKIAPIPDARFTFAEASLETKYGTIFSGWNKTKTGFQYHVTIPEGATADITIAGETRHVGAGDYVFEA